MDRGKKDDFWGLLVAVISLVLIVFFLIALIFLLGREMVVRLNAQITEGIQEFNFSQKEIMP